MSQHPNSRQCAREVTLSLYRGMGNGGKLSFSLNESQKKRKHLISYPAPGLVLDTFICHLVITLTLYEEGNDIPNFIDEETEAQDV